MRDKHKSLEFWEQNQNFDLQEFPKCHSQDCQLPLEIQNRYPCRHCLKIFCSHHVFTFHHVCPNVPKEKQSLPPIKVNIPKCSFKTCHQKMDLCNRFQCPHCSQEFCMSHRHDFSHFCSNSAYLKK